MGDSKPKFKNRVLNAFETEFFKIPQIIQANGPYYDWYSDTVIYLSSYRKDQLESNFTRIFEKLYDEIYTFPVQKSRMISNCERVLCLTEARITGHMEAYHKIWRKHEVGRRLRLKNLIDAPRLSENIKINLTQNQVFT